VRPKLFLAISIGLVSLITLGVGPCNTDGGQVVIPGLAGEVSVTTDGQGVWHITAEDDLDLAIAQGYVHCRDRLFQMDDTRRQVDGTRSEVLGIGRIGSDIQARVVGLHRAAQRSFDAAPASFQAILQAYADGVNHCIDTLPLPPEYAELELTSARPWEAVDAVKIGKAISASLSLDIDTGLTEDLLDFINSGIANSFDGQVFFSEDVHRSAPMDPASTVPDATSDTPFDVAWKAPNAVQLARVGKAAARAEAKLEQHPLFDLAIHRRQRFVGSNEWGVGSNVTAAGRPIIANDPHLSLNAPSTFWEWHLIVEDDPDEGPMNVSGVGFPGSPGVILGQNEDITWGATTNPMDVSDVFEDELHVFRPECFLIGSLACIFSEGTFHQVEITFPTYFVNLVGDGVDDNLVDITGSLPADATTIATVPFRSFGAVIDIADPSVIGTGGITEALVLQYTGFHATQELQTFALWNRSENLDDFRDGLERFDVGSQNWAYADVEGNLAYFSSAEMPLRRDLEDGFVSGLPPYFVREGVSGDNNWVPDPARSQGQTIPYAILPADEMPHTVNPENDFFVNANNDPAGTTLDNDPLNQVRKSNPNAIYYLNPGYAIGMRAGRITQLIEDAIAGPGKITAKDMKRFQANTQQLDAELLTPFLLEAFENASAQDAAPELAALAADAGVSEAIDRIGSWDFSTPTGLDEGYDASDLFGHRFPLFSSGHGGGQDEIDASVAATLYNMWRGFAIRNVIDARLADFGLGAGSSEAIKALHNVLSQSPYTGIAAAGIDWIPDPPTLSAEERRDLALLEAMRDALDQLASNDLAPAFGNSTDQEDYRWGKLHRIVFDHAFNDDWDIPTQGGFEDLSPELQGLSRDGGYNVVNASGFSARAIGLESFRFGGGPVRRYVGEQIDNMIRGFNTVPGGPSGIPDDPDYATQLGTWLTADYHIVSMSSRVFGEKETFVPPTAP
jgi:penicillin amidase